MTIIKGIPLGIYLLILGFPLYSQPNFGNEKLESIGGNYDTISYSIKHGFIVFPVSSNNETKTVIFDTGADLCLFDNDTIYSFTGINVNTKGSRGEVIKNKLDLIENFQINNALYTNVNAIRVDFPQPLTCVADGIIGNNIVKQNNWIFNENELILTEKKVLIKNVPAFNIVYQNSNRLFADVTIQEDELNALIDYGGNFGLEFPLSYLEKLLNNDETERYIKSTWSINGVSVDTIFSFTLSSIEFCGYTLNDIPVSFSKDLQEIRIGLKVLDRFNTVVIDNKKMKIQFDGVKISEKKNDKQVNFDLRNGDLVLTGLNIDNKEYKELKVGEKIQSINGRSSSSFSSYCEFLDWYLSLEHINFTTHDGTLY